MNIKFKHIFFPAIVFLASSFTSGAPFQYPLGDLGLPADYNANMLSSTTLRAIGPAALPQQFNWQDSGCVTPSKNQGSCGSCWAFASVGSYESKMLINNKGTVDLSEQQQTSCNTAMSGCCGGSANAPRYWEAVLPVMETCTGYPSLGESCRGGTTACSALPTCTPVFYNIKTFHTVNFSNLADVKNDLITFGPGYFRFTVYRDFHDIWWSSAYPGDVYRHDTTMCSDDTIEGGHAVLLIGYDDAKGAFLLKNSWGSSTSGPNGDGTFWMAYSGHDHDLGFGMSNFELDISDTVTNFCLLAKETIMLRDRARATCFETKAGSFFELGADGMLGGNLTVDGPATLRDRGLVDGDITLADRLTLGYGARYTGTLTEFANVDPVTIAQKSVAVGTTDIIVQNDKTRTINPGTYRNLFVYDRGKLIMRSGVYNFNLIQFYTNTTLTCIGDVEVNANGNISISNDDKMVVDPSKTITFYSNGTYVNIGVQSQFKGEMIAPNAKVQICDRANIAGCVKAKRIELGCDVILTE